MQVGSLWHNVNICMSDVMTVRHVSAYSPTLL